MKKLSSRPHFGKRLANFFAKELEVTLSLALMLSFIVGTSLASNASELSPEITAQATQTSSSWTINGVAKTAINFGATRQAGSVSVNLPGTVQTTSYAYSLGTANTGVLIDLDNEWAGGSVTVYPATGANFSAQINEATASNITSPVTLNVSATQALHITFNGTVSISGIAISNVAPTWVYKNTTQEVNTIPTTKAVALTLVPNSLTSTVGSIIQAVAVSTDANKNVTGNAKLTWTTDNASVATVNYKGQISIKGAGTATITATAGDLVASIVVTGKTVAEVTKEASVPATIKTTLPVVEPVLNEKPETTTQVETPATTPLQDLMQNLFGGANAGTTTNTENAEINRLDTTVNTPAQTTTVATVFAPVVRAYNATQNAVVATTKAIANSIVAVTNTTATATRTFAQKTVSFLGDLGQFVANLFTGNKGAGATNGTMGAGRVTDDDIR